MKTQMNRKKIFNSSLDLVANLQNKALAYPLIAKLYIPLIEAHAKEHPIFADFDDWLMIQYFYRLYCSTDEQLGAGCHAYLQKTEDDLSQIRKILGEVEYDKLCQDFLNFASHPTIDGVHNKILDFYGELKGMLYFAGLGHAIARISRIDGKKTPDFIATRNDDHCVVECKFIHVSCPFRTFTNRYLRLLWDVPELTKPRNIKTWDEFTFPVHPTDLSQKNIDNIKSFIHEIVENALSLHEMETEVKSKVKIRYERKEAIAEAVAIDNQVALLGGQLRVFFDDYVARRIEQAKKQLHNSDQENQKQCVYIFLELDQEYNMPFGEMDVFKVQIIEDFLKKNKLDVDIIIETWPPLPFKYES